MQRFPIAQARSAFSSARSPFSRQITTGCQSSKTPIGRSLASSKTTAPPWNARKFHTESGLAPSSKKLGLGLLVSPIAHSAVFSPLTTLDRWLWRQLAYYTPPRQASIPRASIRTRNMSRRTPICTKHSPMGLNLGICRPLRLRTECA